MTKSPISEREKMQPITAPAIATPDVPDFLGVAVAEGVDEAKAAEGRVDDDELVEDVDRSLVREDGASEDWAVSDDWGRADDDCALSLFLGAEAAGVEDAGFPGDGVGVGVSLAVACAGGAAVDFWPAGPGAGAGAGVGVGCGSKA